MTCSFRTAWILFASQPSNICVSAHDWMLEQFLMDMDTWLLYGMARATLWMRDAKWIIHNDFNTNNATRTKCIAHNCEIEHFLSLTAKTNNKWIQQQHRTIGGQDWLTSTYYCSSVLFYTLTLQKNTHILKKYRIKLYGWLAFAVKCHRHITTNNTWTKLFDKTYYD